MIKNSALGLRRVVRYGAIVMVALTLATGGVVVASVGLIPDPSGLIHGCYDNATGAMREGPVRPAQRARLARPVQRVRLVRLVRLAQRAQRARPVQRARPEQRA